MTTRHELETQYENWRMAMISDNHKEDLFESARWIYIVCGVYDALNGYYDDDEVIGLSDIDLLEFATKVEAYMTKHDLGLPTSIQDMMDDHGPELITTTPEDYTPIPVNDTHAVFAVAGNVRHYVIGGSYDECRAFCAEHNWVYPYDFVTNEEGGFEWGLIIEDK
jgi:hypothetical protein